MKGIFLLGALLAVLIVAYLLMSNIKAPVAPEVQSTLGETNLMNAPAKAESLVEESMKKEAERLKALEQDPSELGL
jgi:4-amino-4-deoxy-L-arabinose transferase-like glycosyltransferase